MAENSKVELHEAFFWICDACGSDNFARAVTIEPGTELARDITMGVKGRRRLERLTAAIAGGEFLVRPDGVECHACGSEYAVE